MGLLGILVGLGLLIWLAFRGWSVLLLAPAAALVAALFGGEPLLANWTQVFMGSAARFLAQFFPLFLLGAVFGKLMEDSGSVSAVADFMAKRLGERRVMLAVVLAGALVTYGGVSLFVAVFVLVPMAQKLFRAATIPRRLMPAALVLGTSTFTMSALPGTPSIQNAIPMPFFGTTPFAAPGLGIIASIIMLGFGLWWLRRAESAARRAHEGYETDAPVPVDSAADDEMVREHATIAGGGRPGGITSRAPQRCYSVHLLCRTAARHGRGGQSLDVASCAATARLFIPSRRTLGGHFDFRCGRRLVRGARARRRDRSGRPVQQEPPACAAPKHGCRANASVLPALSVASLVGFGAVVAALPAFAIVRDWVLAIEGGPLVSLAVATNVLAALTGSASGGLTIALDALGPTYMSIASQTGINPALMHRVAVIGSGTLDILPHNGAVITMLTICGSTHRDSYFDIVMVGIVSAVAALVAVILLGTAFGSF
jgi:H+/gluconate symporter-like permease